MSRRNGQRKLGSTRGSPRRSRTAKASPISRLAVKSRCAHEWDGWGRLSDDGPRQHNSDQSGGPPNLQGGARSSARPDTVRDHRSATRCAKGGHKPNISQCTPGAGLSWTMCEKVPPYTPAFQPYRGEPAVRNDREGRGDVGIIRSPVRASTSTRLMRPSSISLIAALPGVAVDFTYANLSNADLTDSELRRWAK